jgi:hypothetical protein
VASRHSRFLSRAFWLSNDIETPLEEHEARALHTALLAAVLALQIYCCRIHRRAFRSTEARCLSCRFRRDPWRLQQRCTRTTRSIGFARTHLISRSIGRPDFRAKRHGPADGLGDERQVRGKSEHHFQHTVLPYIKGLDFQGLSGITIEAQGAALLLLFILLHRAAYRNNNTQRSRADASRGNSRPSLNRRQRRRAMNLC